MSKLNANAKPFTFSFNPNAKPFVFKAAADIASTSLVTANNDTLSTVPVTVSAVNTHDSPVDSLSHDNSISDCSSQSGSPSLTASAVSLTNPHDNLSSRSQSVSSSDADDLPEDDNDNEIEDTEIAEELLEKPQYDTAALLSLRFDPSSLSAFPDEIMNKLAADDILTEMDPSQFAQPKYFYYVPNDPNAVYDPNLAYYYPPQYNPYMQYASYGYYPDGYYAGEVAPSEPTRL